MTSVPNSLASSLPNPNLENNVKLRARALGFDLVGITSSEPSMFAAEYRDWIGNGYAGEMDYLKRNLERRLDPTQLLPDARSIVVVGMNYYTRGQGSGVRDQEAAAAPLRPTANDLRPTFARYARGDDYHDVMMAKLKELLEYLKSEAGCDADGRVYVDTGPVLEREVARRAGLGWFGKNTMLINTRRGSYFFLGEIITNVLLTPDEPAVGGCGTCTKCLDACPTNAFIAPFVLDSRRCISYLTIELKGAIPEEFRTAIGTAGNRVYGCDICQEVCPFNKDRGTGGRGEEETFLCRAGGLSPAVLKTERHDSGPVPLPVFSAAPTDQGVSSGKGWERLREGDGVFPPLPSEERATVGEGRGEGAGIVPIPNAHFPIPASSVHGSSPTSEPAFKPRDVTVNTKLTDLLYLTDEQFREKFKGSAVKRAKRRGLLRNAAAALAGRDDAEAIAALEHALNDPDELVKDAAEWALTRIAE